jgi:hypothetical protein
VRANAEVLRVQRVEVKDTVGHFELRLDFPMINGRRTAYLRESELVLLAQDAPEVAELLQRCAE